MAFSSVRVSKPGRLVLLLIICFLVLEESVALHHASAGLINRKVLVEKERNVKGKKEGMFVASELRAVPAGPDPLHHNGGSPKKKPRTTP